MWPPPAPNANAPDLHAEIAALRAQIQHLQADQTAVTTQQQAAADDQRQVRFHTVFEHSPLGQKIIAADLTIR